MRSISWSEVFRRSAAIIFLIAPFVIGALIVANLEPLIKEYFPSSDCVAQTTQVKCDSTWSMRFMSTLFLTLNALLVLATTAAMGSYVRTYIKIAAKRYFRPFHPVSYVKVFVFLRRGLNSMPIAIFWVTATAITLIKSAEIVSSLYVEKTHEFRTYIENSEKFLMTYRVAVIAKPEEEIERLGGANLLNWPVAFDRGQLGEEVCALTEDKSFTGGTTIIYGDQNSFDDQFTTEMRFTLRDLADCASADKPVGINIYGFASSEPWHGNKCSETENDELNLALAGARGAKLKQILDAQLTDLKNTGEIAEAPNINVKLVDYKDHDEMTEAMNGFSDVVRLPEELHESSSNDDPPGKHRFVRAGVIQVEPLGRCARVYNQDPPG